MYDLIKHLVYLIFYIGFYNFDYFLIYFLHFFSFSTTDNIACNGTGYDHTNTKEEEVYQDLCALHRTSRSQVAFFDLLALHEHPLVAFRIPASSDRSNPCDSIFPM